MRGEKEEEEEEGQEGAGKVRLWTLTCLQTGLLRLLFL